MSLLHDAYTALLAGLTTKTGNEIHWVNEHGYPKTIEPIDINKETYIVRYYYDNGNIESESYYKKDKRHEKYIQWYRNGDKWFEREYKNGEYHGSYIIWRKGIKRYEENFKNNVRHGKYILWDDDGNKVVEANYKNGELFKETL